MLPERFFGRLRAHHGGAARGARFPGQEGPCRKRHGGSKRIVNPTQFNDKEDLRNYPRTPEADLEVLRAAGADVVFMPSVEEVYPEPDMRVFDFGMLDKVMEGATRPGHFNGVARWSAVCSNSWSPTGPISGRRTFNR